MLILITALLLFAAALALVILRLVRPQFRFTWLTAVGTTFVAWISVLLWRPLLPLSIVLPSWKPSDLFVSAPTFSADGLAWPYALSLVTLALAFLLTASVREGFPNSINWAVSLTLCGLGLLAVTANNPLTLVLVWAGIDLADLATMLGSVNGRGPSQRAVIAFSIHAVAIVFVLLAQVIGGAAGKPLNFISTTGPSEALNLPQVGLLLLVAAGLRLGVLPLHLPYSAESSLRRGVGTTLRLVSAAASLALLSRIPTASLASPWTPILMILSALAAVYGGWMWLRAPDDLTGRPFWMIGLASLAVASALRGNPSGAAAWGVALVLAGASLFLSSVQQVWLNRALFVSALAISALPFSLTASGWQNSLGALDLTLPAFIIAQACLLAGFVRHALRPSTRASLASQPVWARSIYPAGIGLLLIVQLMLGLWGWDGAFQIGAWPVGVAACLLSLGLFWAIPRFAALNPVPAHWLQPASVSRLDQIYQSFWGLYRWLGSISQTLSAILEGEAGIMWTLVFLILFVILIVQRKP